MGISFQHDSLGGTYKPFPDLNTSSCLLRTYTIISKGCTNTEVWQELSCVTHCLGSSKLQDGRITLCQDLSACLGRCCPLSEWPMSQVIHLHIFSGVAKVESWEYQNCSSYNIFQVLESKPILIFILRTQGMHLGFILKKWTCACG